MKKQFQRKFIVSSIIVILLFLTSCTPKQEFSNENSKEDIVFESGEHEREEIYAAQFDTMYTKQEELTVHIAKDIYEEQQAKEIWEQLYSDYGSLREFAKESDRLQPVTVYIVDQTITNFPQTGNGEIFISSEDVEKETYRPYLVKELLGIKPLWQCIGLSAAVFEKNGLETDTAELKNYFSKKENMNVLSLFPGYFVTEFAEEDTIRIAEESACLLSQYILDHYGTGTYLSDGENITYRAEWLKAIGVTEEIPWTETEMENIKDTDFFMSADIPLTLTCGTWNFQLRKTDWLKDSNQVFLFVRDSMNGYKLLLDELDRYGVAERPELQETLKMKKYVCVKNSTAKNSQTKNATIFLNQPHLIWHEMVHALMPDLLTASNIWVGEGMAEFLSYHILSQSEINAREWKEEIYFYLTEYQSKEDTEEIAAFQQLVIDAYKKQKQFPGSAEEVDTALFYHILAAEKTLNHTMKSGWQLADISLQKHVSNQLSYQPDEDANGLSYVEACMFIEYLTEQYGFEKVFDFAYGKADFDTTFQKTYTELYREWYQTLKNQEEI